MRVMTVVIQQQPSISNNDFRRAYRLRSDALANACWRSTGALLYCSTAHGLLLRGGSEQQRQRMHQPAYAVMRACYSYYVSCSGDAVRSIKCCCCCATYRLDLAKPLHFPTSDFRHVFHNVPLDQLLRHA